MRIMNRICKILTEPAYRFGILMRLGVYDRLPDEKYLKKAYKAYMGRPLHLDEPLAYTEKIQWLKLNDRREIYTTMVDKAQAKDYVSQVLGTSEYCIETL